MQRKKFIQNLGALTTGTVLFPELQFANAMPKKLLDTIGVQLFSMPRVITDDVEALFQLIHQMGYRSIEVYGPYAFNKVEDEKLPEGFPKIPSGFLGLSPEEFRSLAAQYSIRIPSLHTDLDTLEQKMEKLAEAAHGVGANYVTLPMLPSHLIETMDDYKRMADRFNAIGIAAKNAGVRFAYHNHGQGFAAMEGIVPMEWFLENTDADTVFLEMDIFWTTAAGVSPISLLEKYGNRYRLLHIKDMVKPLYFEKDKNFMEQLFEFFPQITAVGSGVIDVQTILNKALEVGVEHYFVEHDLCPDPKTALSKSFQYLNSL